MGCTAVVMASTGWRWPLLGIGVALALQRALSRVRSTELDGKSVVITGGSRGLGLALARELARANCSIVLAARDPDELERARHDVERLGARVMAVACDVGDRAQVQHLIERATAELGHV